MKAGSSSSRQLVRVFGGPGWASERPCLPSPCPSSCLRASSTAACAARRDVEHEQEEILGLNRKEQQLRSQAEECDSTLESVDRSPKQSRLEASRARSILAGLSPGHLSSLDTLLAALNPKTQRGDPSRLELHAVAHHLVKSSRQALAASYISHQIEKQIQSGAVHAYRSTRRGLVEQRTLLKVVGTSGKSKSKMPLQDYFTGQTAGPDRFHHSNLAPKQASAILTAELNLLRSLLKIRHPRPPALYSKVIRQCVRERLPDVAATVYVGLVEEWITEGRVAEGASLAEFHEGGGPARTVAAQGQRIPSPTTQERNRWFQGVRTWKIPGETLSPHDRLDLWHPYKLALPEKMRNFPLPLPTSPPSLVPEPSIRLLSLVLSAIRLDPNDPQTSPREYAASARALAILANTVHNRTLPIGALPALLVAFRGLPHQPTIYPASFSAPPVKEPYAYTASSHVHGALLSLLLSPPTYPQHIRVQSRTFSSALSDIFTASKANYVFPPLSIKSCNVLLQYAFRKLQRPAVVSRLVTYMKESFGGTLMTMSLNILYRNGTLLRRNDIAEAAEKMLFGDTGFMAVIEQLRKESGGKDKRRMKDGAGVIAKHDKQSIHYVAPDSPPLPMAHVAAPLSIGTEETPQSFAQPDEFSLAALISHLGATSQFDRLVSLVYILIPTLKQNRTSGQRATPLSPRLYSTLIANLSKARATGLARMVYIAAKEAERDSWEPMRQALRKDPSLAKDAVFGWFLSIHAYTSMLQVVAQNRNYTSKTERSGSSSQDQVQRARDAATNIRKDMTEATDWAVALSEKLGSRKGLAPPLPDQRFFNEYISAHADAWQLRRGDGEDIQLSAPELDHIESLVNQMDAWGVRVPSALRQLIAGGSTSSTYVRNPVRSTKGLGATHQWAGKTRAATEAEQRAGEESEEDWVIGVEQGFKRGRASDQGS